MAEILLSSETFIKSVTNISDNVAGKYILPSLREAQDVGLKGILGACLLARLKELVAADPATHTRPIDQPQYAAYKDLVNECQYYLAYRTLVEVANKVSYKLVNAGVAKTGDENVTLASYDEIAKQQYYYEAKADAYCRDLQRWVLAHKDEFAELDACTCEAIRANLYSSASCGLFLGGARGRKLPGGGGCCK